MKTYQRFGVMIDCSRNAVMKPAEVKRFIDYMVKMGYNTLELYTEDTFELEGEPYFGHMRGRYTGEEIKEIDGYAISKGVELIPCVQTLAHFHTLVRHPVYHDIVDMGDSLLVGEEKTYQLIEKIFAFAAKNFTSRNINIGMDEAVCTGLGKSLKKHGYKSPNVILKEHLQRVMDIARKYGFTPHMWSDMFIRSVNGGDYYGKNLQMTDEIRDTIPKDVKLAYWDYYHLEKSEYDEMLRVHNDTGREVWFCGAAWSWCGFVPLWEKTLLTMKPAMESVREHGVKNVLVTMWGDGGKECSFFAMLPLLYAVRRYADGVFDMQIISREFFNLFGLRTEDFKLLSKINGHEKLDLYTCSMHLYNDCLLGLNDRFVEENGRVNYGEYAEKIQLAAERAGEFSYIFDCIASLCRVLERKYDFGLRVRKAYFDGGRDALNPFIAECDELIFRIESFYGKFKSLWMKENKPFGFEIQTMRIGGLIQRIKDCKQRFTEYVSGNLEKIEELEQAVLPAPEYDAQYYTLMSAGRL
ncbi:MAG: beta-N-acetylhexosaminidase [Clostridia bacterium]|nr:beta-N-acetylhexosaminidase [Clostridia bacterium]